MRTYLTLLDVFVLAIIFFGQATIAALLVASISQEGLIVEQEFSSADNYFALKTQAVFLVLAWMYLRYRRVDMGSWLKQWRIGGYAFIQGIALFIITALAADILGIMLFNRIEGISIGVFTQIGYQFRQAITEVDFSLFIYSLFNGFYEEVFFLAICFAVRPELLKIVLPLSLGVRFIFHLYQGVEQALQITFGMGLVFLLVVYYRRHQAQTVNLIPFFIAHAIADMLGLGLGLA